MKKHIVFTGGGTAGHVTPNIAIIEKLNQKQWQIAYIGSENGVEQTMISDLNIAYYPIKTGKFRRYFSWQNFLDPLFIVWGIIQAFFLLRRLKTDVVFSKGGFVAFPVVFAAWLNRIPVIAHESDLTPGLANRLCFPFVSKICVTFAAGKDYFKNNAKVMVTGTPIRQALFKGDKARGLALCGFSTEKPCLLVVGGSQGAGSINQVVREALPVLTQSFQVIHLCGKAKLDPALQALPAYHQFEYANTEMADLFAASDVIVSRAGANSLYEILALQKPHVLIPLSAKVSRGDQIHNARYFAKQHISVVLDDDSLTVARLTHAVDDVWQRAPTIKLAIKALGIVSATDTMIDLLNAL